MLRTELADDAIKASIQVVQTSVPHVSHSQDPLNVSVPQASGIPQCPMRNLPDHGQDLTAGNSNVYLSLAINSGVRGNMHQLLF